MAGVAAAQPAAPPRPPRYSSTQNSSTQNSPPSPPPSSHPMAARTVQDCIEGVLADSTEPPRSGPVLSPTQWLVWSLATAGKFFEGWIVFMGGIALPLVSRQFGMNSTEQGLA